MDMRKEPNSPPKERDFLIAYHIRELRQGKYPGRGGGQKCAEAMNVSRWQYYNWENGSRTPREKNLKMIADFHGVELEYFTVKPDDWQSIHAKMLSKWRKKLGIEDDPVSSNVPANPLPTTRQAMDSMDQMNAIIKHLVKKQLMVEEGQLDPQEFNKALAELHDYTMFKLPG